MSLSSRLVLEDVGALLLGPSYLMADPLGPLLDEDDEPLSGGPASPLSFSSYADSSTSSPFSSLSPPPSPPSLLGCKAGSDLLPLPWLSADELLNAHIGADHSKEDAFYGMDWMAEKIDLSNFDLDSLIGSCDPDEQPSSPEELLASLESHMDLDLVPLPFPTASTQEDLALPLPELPTLPIDLPLQEPELEARPEPISLEIEIKIKYETPSPVPSPLPPLSPAFTLELGSEVDVSELEKAPPEPADVLQAPSVVLSLSPAHIVVVLAPKEERSPYPGSCAEPSDSDSGIDSVSGSPQRYPSPAPSPLPAGSSRTKPYSKPDPDAVTPATAGKVKSVSGAPKVVEKKLKKMEQNKTAANRYRKKKRVEQDVLNTECTELEKRNRELGEKADSISREIQYLKDLIEEVRSAKNRKTKASSA